MFGIFAHIVLFILAAGFAVASNLLLLWMNGERIGFELPLGCRDCRCGLCAIKLLPMDDGLFAAGLACRGASYPPFNVLVFANRLPSPAGPEGNSTGASKSHRVDFRAFGRFGPVSTTSVAFQKGLDPAHICLWSSSALSTEGAPKSVSSTYAFALTCGFPGLSVDRLLLLLLGLLPRAVLALLLATDDGRRYDDPAEDGGREEAFENLTASRTPNRKCT